MSCESVSMLVGPGGTGCDEVRFSVHGGWDSRDASVLYSKLIILIPSLKQT